MGHPGLVRQAGLVLRGGLCGFGELGTSCLYSLAMADEVEGQIRGVLFKTSKQMRPSLSMFGW